VSGRLAGKVALVTGGASGIGQAICLMFAREGAAVMVFDADRNGAHACAMAIATAGAQALDHAGDVRQSADAAAAVGRCERELGGLDILVNNAGVIGRGTVESTDEAEWRRVLDVNLTGVYVLSRAAIPAVRRRGGGSIINVSSAAGLAAWYDQAAYDAAKGGVVNLTRSMALDFARDRIRVNCLVPAHVTTPMSEKYLAEGGEQARRAREQRLETIPLGRYAQPDEIAYAAVFLASDESSYMTGSPLVVDGGYLAR
jgi:NAD(P)-dependent dehydrogenase (short-subunit alcohol dehydrogenase family)